MLKISDREWKSFNISKTKTNGLFEIRATNSGIDKNKLINEDKEEIPYITRSNINNGVSQFVALKQNNKYRNEQKNVITIGLDTQTVFYQPFLFHTGQNIQILSFEKINRRISLFLIPLIIKQVSKLSWGGNGATLSRLNRMKIMLPIDKKGDPDYDFMEKFIKEREEIKKKEYIDFINKEENIYLRRMKMLKISDRELLPFKVGDLFEIEKCKCNNASELKEGIIPYVGATNKNNGTMSFCGNKEKITKGKCIVFVCDGQGSVGFSFYKQEDFVGSTTLKVGRNKKLNRFNAMFFTTALDKNRVIYSFGYKRNEERLKNEIIFLPVDKKGNPDYDFMEKFIKEREEIKKKEYINFINKEINRIKPTIRKTNGGGVKFKEYKIIDVLKRSINSKAYHIKDLEYIKMEEGLPYITRTSIDNGLNAIIKKGNYIINPKNSISFGAENAKYFYQPYKYITGNKMYYYMDPNLNKYSLLYITNCLNTSIKGSGFSYGMGLTGTRSDKRNIMLPVNDNNEINYKYMENYIKTKLIEKYEEYKLYIHNK